MNFSHKIIYTTFQLLAVLLALSIVLFALTPAAANADTNMNHNLEMHTTLNNGSVETIKNNIMEQHGWFVYTVLNGQEEVPGPGDSDGWGFFRAQVYPNQGKLCVDMFVGNIATATAAHIHEAAKGASGPVVITLPTPDGSGRANGCLTGLDSNNLSAIKNNPSQFYVNVHNTPYPNGAVRGQLSK